MEEEVAQVLDTMHEAASKADFDRHFSLFADSAIFLGTDKTERWTKSEFQAYAKPSFDQGLGWTYSVLNRNIYLHGNNVAWFDEALKNEDLGESRGSGVLTRADGEEWKVEQYNLSIPIPNKIANKVVALIRKKTKG